MLPSDLYLGLAERYQHPRSLPPSPPLNSDTSVSKGRLLDSFFLTSDLRWKAIAAHRHRSLSRKAVRPKSKTQKGLVAPPSFHPLRPQAGLVSPCSSIIKCFFSLLNVALTSLAGECCLASRKPSRTRLLRPCARSPVSLLSRFLCLIQVSSIFSPANKRRPCYFER